MSHANQWFTHSESDALAAQRTSIESGLSHDEALRRRVEFGLNQLHEFKRKSGWSILLAQFTDLLVLVLIGAAVIAGFLGEPQDTIAIVTIILLNALLGFSQEFRAEKAMESLKALAAPQARVRRLGDVLILPAFELVPGDIVLLEAGDMIPADVRLVEAFDFQINESALTGESLPVAKKTERLTQKQLTVADQQNMAFKGTLVTSGRATGLVVRTGMSTELGRIATLLKEEVDVKTPLQNRISFFAKRLTLIVLGLCVVIFLIGLLRGEERVRMFLTALSLAVAAIPEALPAVVTLSLALGARVMIQRKALIRKLPAVEALGSVTTICSDKTGTLTENRMVAQRFYVDGKIQNQAALLPQSNESWRNLFRVLALNHNVTKGLSGKLQGDPTETALVRAASEFGIDSKTLLKEFPLVAELPFSSERGRMCTLHEMKEGALLCAKGAPEKLLPLCRDIDVKALRSVVDEMAGQGLRVLAVAHRSFEQSAFALELKSLEKDLIFLGFVGLMDPPRAGVKESIEQCQTAGIHVVMITGDHPATARVIAQQLGILKQNRDEVLTGDELMNLSEEQLKARILKVGAFARVAPEQKIQIVKALQASGEIVAMTGDGVNDAPALRRADVGVSMGLGGTDVAREASHVVLLDDNFSTIVSAVREGRRIYDNIRKFLRYVLSGNSGELLTLFAAPFVGLPTPLLPIHILWVNLVTDGLPGLALALEPQEKNIMRRPPRAPKESVFAHGLWQHSVWVGSLTAAVTLGTMAWAYHTQHAHWQSMAFTVLTTVQMGHVLAIRSERESLFSLGIFSNLWLLGAVLVTFGLQLCTLYIPVLNSVFKTEPLSLNELLICLAVSTTVFIAVEIEKLFGVKSKASA